MLTAPTGEPGPDILSIDEDKRQRVIFWRTWPNYKPHQDKPGWYIAGTLIRARPVMWQPLPKSGNEP